MGEKGSSIQKKSTSASKKDVHRLALKQGDSKKAPPHLQEESDHGLDLSVLLKPQKNLDQAINRNDSNTNLLGASFASELSVLTEDGTDGEGSRSLNELSWVGSEGIVKDDDDDDDDNYHGEAMEILDKAMTDLREMSLEDQSELDISAIDDAIQNIQSALKEDRDEGSKELEYVNKDLDAIRSQLTFAPDAVSSTQGDDEAMMWETILCRLRGGAALSLYSLLACKFQDASAFLAFGAKFAGVAVLCFLAGVPRRDEKEATAAGFQVRLLFMSRKTVLLLVYIIAWISVFDASMEAWEAGWRSMLNRHERKALTDADNSSSKNGMLDTRLSRGTQYPAPGAKSTDFPKRRSEKATVTEDVSKPYILTDHLQGTEFKVDAEEQKHGVGSTAKNLIEPQELGKGVVKVTETSPMTQEQEANHMRESVPVSDLSAMYIKSDLKPAPEVADLSKSLRDMGVQEFAAKDNILHSTGGGKRRFFGYLRMLIREALHHGLSFMVGSDDGHRSQHMLDMLHETWFQRRWH